MVELDADKKILSLLLISFCLLSNVFGPQIKVSAVASSNRTSTNEGRRMTQNATDTVLSESIKDYQKIVESFRGSIIGTFQNERPILRASDSSSSVSHLMCKGHDSYYNPVNPTTIFRPSDTKAECLMTVSMNRGDTIEWRWYYRNDSAKAWVFIDQIPYENRSYVAQYYSGLQAIAGYIGIDGCWPGVYYPRAYKVEVYYLSTSLLFSEFFEVTNGGLDSPRMCKDIDTNGNPVNMASRFTIGDDTRAYDYLRFENIAYFNEELGCSHSYTTVWIQPNGSIYEALSGWLADYKDNDIDSNYWKNKNVTDDYITINSSTPVGNWRVEVYLDDYCINNTWIPYGPISTTPFIVGSQSVANWTFMVYLDGDNSLEGAAIDTFLKLASVGSSSQVNVVVQMDRIGIDDRYGNWTDCKRFYVTKGITPTPENATLDLGELNMGDPETLRDFNNWTMDNYPANHYFLVLWDHGAGFMGFCFDITNGNDSLSLQELSQALSRLPAVIDVVFVDACGASMAEVAYQIKDYANMLVGPEEFGYEPAPYDNYLSSLTSSSSMSPNALAVEIVAGYMRWCRPLAIIQNATMSAIDLTQITSSIEVIDNFALKLKQEEITYHEQISLARSQTEEGAERVYQGPYGSQTGYCIDLYDFAKLIHQDIPDEELRNTADQLMAALNSTGNMMIVNANKGRPYWQGVSIFYPDEIGKYQSFESAYEETSFAIDTLWNEFVKSDLSGCALTIQTAQPNVPIELNNDSYTTDDRGIIRLFVPPGKVTINVATLIPTGFGSRIVFAYWNDSDTSNPRTLYVSGTLKLAAEYETQYLLFMDENFGRTDPNAGEHWYSAGSSVRISAAAPAATSGEQFVSFAWTGTGNGSYSGPDSSSTITMNGPINETATWKHEYYLTVASAYGSPAPTSGWFGAGKSIIISVTSPVSGLTGTQYVLTGWNATGSVSTSGTTSSANLTTDQALSITWNWKTQYRVVIRTNPAGLSPQPKLSSPGPWYDEGTALICTAQNVSGKVFDHWTTRSLTTEQSSDWDRGMTQINVTIDGRYEAEAHYVPAPTWWDILLRPENLQIIVLAGGMLSVFFVGAVWIRARRRKSGRKPLARPEIKVPTVKDFLPDRITTGSEDLDGLLFGGLPKNYAVALTSPSCDERDLLINRFLEAGARNGEDTFCLTADPGNARSLAEEFQSNFYLFVCNPRADTMVESLPNAFRLKGVENLTEITITLTKAFRTLDASTSGPRRACIGIISDVLLQHHAVQTKRWLSDLIPELRSKGFTTLAVMNPQMHPSEEVQAILELFEGEISIHEKEGLQKTVKIKKMYNQKYLDCELPLRKEK